MSKKHRKVQGPRSVNGLMRSVERIQAGQGQSARERKLPRPANSVDVANDAIKTLSRNDNTPKTIKPFAEAVMSLWGRSNTAENAKMFWLNPDYESLKFFRDAYLGGLGTLAFAGIADIEGFHPKPSDRVGGLFAPDRRLAVELCRDRLAEVAGGIGVLSELDGPAPLNLWVCTWTDEWRDRIGSKNEFPTRLTSYDPAVLTEYARTMPTGQFIKSGPQTYQGQR